MTIDDDPDLAAERVRRLTTLGSPPRWWRLFARRRWHRERRAILAMNVDRMSAMMRRLYPSETIERMVGAEPIDYAAICKSRGTP